MTDDKEYFHGGSAQNGGGASGRTYMVQPGRDLLSNWEVDLAYKLEEYLLKICSGEMTLSEEDQVLHSVNFAEGTSTKLYLKKTATFQRNFSSCPSKDGYLHVYLRKFEI